MTGTLNTHIVGNYIYGASAGSFANDSSIEIVTDGVTADQQTSVVGNYVVPGPNTRSALRINGTSPVPSNTRIIDNVFAQSGFFAGSVELDAPAAVSDFQTAYAGRLVRPTYGPVVTIDASKGNQFEIGVTDGNNFAIPNPTGGFPGQRIVLTFRNGSGGAIGLVQYGPAWLGQAVIGWTYPLNGFNRSIEFYYNGTSWIELYRSQADVANV